MRRVLVLLVVIVVAVIALFLVGQDPAPNTVSDTPVTEEIVSSTVAVEAAETRRERRERDRLDTTAERGLVDDAQTREQDPTLARLVGRVMRDARNAAPDARVDVTRGGQVLARVRAAEDGRFEVRNLPPGGATLVDVVAPGHAPGGIDDLVLRDGETTDLGTVYLGVAIDPSVDNRLRVRVRGPDDEAVQGARVSLTSQLYSTFVSLGEYDKQPGGVVLRKETDARGEVAFAPIPPGTYDVFVMAPGLTFETESRLVVQRDTDELLTLELGRAQSIVGRVVGPDGEPLEGAMVAALRFGDFAMYPSVESDEEGRFEIGGLTGGNYMVFALAEDIGGSEQRTVTPSGEEIELQVQTGVKIRVRIVDGETQEPVTSFGLRPFRTGPFGYLYSPLLEIESADGTAELALPESAYGLEVVAPGYQIHQEAAVPLDMPGPVSISLQPGGLIRGRVVSQSNGQPIVGAHVYIKRGGFPATPHKDLQTVTDAEGLFTLDKLGLDATNIRISHVDHTERNFAGVQPVEAPEEGELPDPEEFRLGEGGTIQGVVYDETSKPAAGESMYLTVGGFDLTFNRSTKVDSQGRYRFEHVPTDRRYTVSVRSFMPGSGGRSQSDVSVTEGGTTTVDFGKSQGGVTVRGTVVQDGAPRGGVPLTLTATDGRTTVVQGRSDDAGAFAFENVAPGAYQITSQSGRRVTVAVDVPSEGEPDPVEIDLVGSGVAGRIVDAATGEGLGGVYVEVERVVADDAAGLVDLQRKWKGGRSSGGDGTFRFEGLEAGRYRIRALRDGYGTGLLDDVVVAAGEVTTGLELELGPEGSVTGKVTDSSGQPVEGAALEVVDSNGRSLFLISLTQSSSDGTFTQGGLPPGDYTLTFKKDGHAPATADVTVRVGEATRADFTLLSGGDIEVTALTLDGAPVDGAVVVLRDADGELVKRGLSVENLFTMGRTKTDRFGRATLPGLAPGGYRVSVEIDGRVSESVRADVVESGSTAVEIRVPPAQ